MSFSRIIAASFIGGLSGRLKTPLASVIIGYAYAWMTAQYINSHIAMTSALAAPGRCWRSTSSRSSQRFLTKIHINAHTVKTMLYAAETSSHSSFSSVNNTIQHLINRCLTTRYRQKMSRDFGLLFEFPNIIIVLFLFETLTKN